jgi:hypothetical protein
MDEQLDFLKLIAQRLDSASIAYMVTGSMAMGLYAVPRMTRDIDLVVEFSPGDAERIASLFEKDCYIDLDSIRDAVARHGMFNIIHNEWIIKVDFIVRKDTEYRKVEFERRRNVDVQGSTVSIVTPEDLILSKLCWARDSQSEIQQDDVRHLIKSVVGLDWPYLEKWAVTLGVGVLLGQVKVG